MSELQLNFDEAARNIDDEENKGPVDFDAAARNVDQSRAQYNLGATEDVKPEEVAQQRDTAKRLGAPLGLVELDFDTAARALRAKEEQDALADRPGLQGYLADPQNAKIARDDVNGLGSIEDLHGKSFAEKTDAVFNDPISRLVRAGSGEVVEFLGRALEGAGDLYTSVNELFAPLTGYDFGRKVIPTGDLARLAFESAAVPFENVGGAINIPRQGRSFAEEVTGAVGQLGAQIGLTALNPALGVAAFTTAGAGETQDIIDRIKKSGKETRYGETGENLAVLGGALVTGISEKIGLNLLLNRAPPGIKNRAVRYVVDKVLAAGIEATEETAEAALRDFVIQLGVDEERQILQDFSAREAGVAGTAAAIVRTVLGVRYAKTNEEKTADMLDAARENVLRQRSPEAFDEFYQSIADRGSDADIRISAGPVMDYLAQAGENPREFFQELGVSEDAITKAYETGGDIEIKAGKFFSLMPDNPYRDQILLNLREAAGAPTVAEAEIRSTQMQERMEKIMEDMTSEERVAVTESTERVRQKFVQDSINAGRSRSEAQNAGAVWDAVFRTALDAYANDENRTRPLSEIAQELEEQVFNVRARSVPFEDRGQPLEQTVDTTSENFSNWFRDSKIVNENGEPLVVYHGTDTGFLEFDPDMLGTVTGTSDSLEGFWFSTDRERAKEAAEDAMALSDTNIPEIMELYLSVQNPFYGGSLKGMEIEDSTEIIQEAKAAGHDGVIFDGEMGGQDIIVFEPTQIKSAQKYRPSGTFDPANANILHQTVTDATGKPLAVVHNISEEKLRHAVKMGGLPVPSLAIVDANQEFTNFGNIQLVADPSMVDPRASRRNRVFDADVYSPRYPTGDIERTVDRDAADAAQYELNSIAIDYLGAEEDVYRPGWLQEKLSDIGTRFLSDERPIQVAFLNSIGVEIPMVGQRPGELRAAIEVREGEFNQFIEETYGSLITGERILDQITDTGRRYLPHNLDTVVRIMKRELRGGERFSYGVGSIRAQVAKQFKSLKEIKDARESIVTEADMQAFKDDANDAFDELAKALAPFYTADVTSFNYLDVFGDMLSDFARRGERALDQSGFENVSDEAKQKIVNFLANLRQAPTEYFEAKIQRAVGLDEFQGAIVPPETPQDIRNLLEENGLRVIEATDRSEALQQAFSQELFQSTVPLQSRPMKLEGTGPHGRVTNWDFATALNDRHMAKYGRALDPNDADDFKIIVRELNREYRNQQRQDDTGNGWYVEDIEAAVDVTRAIIPELGQPINRDAFLIMAALLSPQQKPPANWDNAIYAMQGFIKTGRIALTKPSGKNFGVNSHRTGLQLFQHLIDERGLAAAIEWLQTPHTGRELAEVRKASGLFKPKKQALTNFTASETNLTDTYLGIYMMGPKVGDFMLNATGFDPSAVTVDLWLARTYNRMIGRLLDVSPQKVEAKEIASEVRGVEERNKIKRVVRELADLNGISPSAMQAALWYYEQRLYRNHGINSESTNFQGAAINAAQKRKIPVAGRGGGVQGVGEAEAGDVQTDLFQTVDPPPSGIGRLYSQAQRATEALPQQKATASQWLSHLKKNGVKDDELNWVVGLEEFLNSQKTIDKDDLLEFIQQNGIKLDEVQLGGPEAEDPKFLVEAREGFEEALQELDEAEETFVNALEGIGFSDEAVTVTLEKVASDGSSVVSDAQEASPGIMDLAFFYHQAYINRQIALETLQASESNIDEEAGIKFRRYTLEGPREAPDQEFYLTLPADLTKGNADVEDWLVPMAHQIGDEVSDNRLVIRIRANGRVLEDGRRVLFIEEMQDDRGQQAREEGVRERISRLEERQLAYRVAGADARKVMAKYFGGLQDIPTNERFAYLENLVNTAANYEQRGERWVTSLNYREFDFTPEDIASVDRYIELENTEPLEVRRGGAPVGIPDRPFLGSNKVVPLALKRMMVEATERGYDAISWTPGEIQTERYSMSRLVRSIEVLDVNNEEALVIVNQGSIGPIALEGVETDPENLGEDPDIVDEMLGQRIINMVPRDRLAEYFGKELADKIVEGGRNQTYDNLELDVGGIGHKKFYNKIVVNAANKLGKKFKAKTGVGKVVRQEAQSDEKVRYDIQAIGPIGAPPTGYQVYRRYPGQTGATLVETFSDFQSAENYARMFIEAQTGELPAVTEDVWVLPLTDELKDTILGEGLPMMQDPDDPLGSFDPVRRVINLFEQANYSTLLHESGHAFVNIMEELSKRDDAPARITENYQAMLEWTGATNAADLDIRINGEAAREKQERLARAFEAYLREGKAPSAKLQSAFSQFKEWLKKIYQNLTQLNVTMDDEIRTVFDKMLATDAEIADMIAVNEFTLDDNPSILSMMDAEEREKAQRLQLAARDRAVEARALEEQRYEAVLASDKYAEELDGVVEEVEKAIYRERPYGAFYFLTNGEFYGDRETPEALQGKRISRQALLDAGYTKEQLKALPRATGKGGRALYSANENDATDPEVLAAFLGYDSGRELIDDMMAITYPGDEIARRAEEIMKSRPDYADPVNDGTMKQITEDALYNAEQAELIEMELDALARAAGTQRESRVFLQAVADRLFKDEPIGTMLSQVKFAAASRRAARASEQAAAKENWQKAFEEKRKEILNFELHRRAVKAKYEVAKAQEKLNRYKRRKVDPNRVDPLYVENVKNLLNFYEFGRPSSAGVMKPEHARTVIEFIEKRQSLGAQVILPGDLIEVAGLDPDSGDPLYVLKTKFWKDMTLPELRSLRDLADNLMKQGRDSSKSAREARLQRGAELAMGILDRTRYRRKKLDRRRTYSRIEEIANIQRAATFAEHRKLESMMRQLDSFEPLGPMYEAVFSPLAEASDNKAHLVTMILKKQEEIGQLLTAEQRKTFNTSKSEVSIEALGGAPMRLEDRLAIALNWGSESSREAVLDDRAKKEQYGAYWNEEAINEILSTLDDNALNFVEATWQFIDMFWEDVTLLNGRTVNGIKTLEEISTGIAPPKVEASPFFVNGRQMSGGYYPLVYDNLSDVRVERESEAELMDRIQSGGFTRAHTTHGYTNARVGSGGRPVRTDLGVINKHLDEVTQDLSYRLAIQEAVKVLGNDDVVRAIDEVMGRPFRENMQEILVRTATGQLNSGELGSFNKHIANLRINMTTAIMGLNLRSIGTQPFGLLQSINEIGVKDVGVGMAWLYKRKTKLNNRIAEIHTMSPYMAERATTMTRELDDIANSLQRRKKLDRMREWGFKPMVYIDVVSVAYPTWYGAYNKAMSGRVEGLDVSGESFTKSNQFSDQELKAIAYADMIVRMTQSAGGAQNLSMVQQRSETMKIMTMMYSYFNTTYNLQAEAFAKARADGSSIPKAVMKPSFIASTMLLQTLPALMASLILDPWPDEDEEEEDPLFAWAKWSLKSMFSYITGQFVFVRDFGSAVTHPFFGFSITPLESMAESAARYPGVVNKTIEEDFSGEAVASLAKKTTQVVGGIAGIPGSNQIAKTADYLYKWSQGMLKNEPDTVVEGVYKALFHGDR